MPTRMVCPICGSPEIEAPEPWREREYYCRNCRETFPAPDEVADLATTWRED